MNTKPPLPALVYVSVYSLRHTVRRYEPTLAIFRRDEEHFAARPVEKWVVPLPPKRNVSDRIHFSETRKTLRRAKEHRRAEEHFAARPI